MGRLYFNPFLLKSLKRGIFLAMALQCAVANDTPKIAFAPKFFYFQFHQFQATYYQFVFGLQY